MLTLFKPWRHPHDLKLEKSSWSETFEGFEFSERQLELMKFFNIRYECSDDRDDFSKHRKEESGNANGGFHVRKDVLANLDFEGYFDDAAGEHSVGDMNDELDGEYRKLNSHELNRMEQLMQADAIIDRTGALDDIEGGEALKIDVPELAESTNTPYRW